MNSGRRMANRYYIDSNIVISYFKSEKGGYTKIQHKRVEELLEKIEKENIDIVLSDLFMKETAKKLKYNTKKEILDLFKTTKVIQAKTKERDLEKAIQLEKNRGIHSPDSVHVAIAKRLNSNYIVTWNMKDFEKTKDIVKPATPFYLTT